MKSSSLVAAGLRALAGAALCWCCALTATAQTATARLAVSDVHVYADGTELAITPGSWYVANVSSALWDTDDSFSPARYPGHVENQRPGESLLAHLANPAGESIVESNVDRAASSSDGLWSVVQSVGVVNGLPANSWITMRATLSYLVDDGAPAAGLGAIVGAHVEAHWMQPLFTDDWYRMGDGSGTFEWTGTFFNTNHPSMGWIVDTYALVGNASLVPEPASVAMLLGGLALMGAACLRRNRQKKPGRSLVFRLPRYTLRTCR